jgi:hypothetical protein
MLQREETLLCITSETTVLQMMYVLHVMTERKCYGEKYIVL